MNAGRLDGYNFSTVNIRMTYTVNGRVIACEYSRPTIQDSNRRHEYMLCTILTNMARSVMQETFRPTAANLGARRHHPMGVPGQAHGGKLLVQFLLALLLNVAESSCILTVVL